jgi:hypothetical protein
MDIPYLYYKKICLPEKKTCGARHTDTGPHWATGHRYSLLRHVWLRRSLRPPQHRRCCSAATPPLPHTPAAASVGNTRLPHGVMAPELRCRCGARGGCRLQRLADAMARAETLSRRRRQRPGRRRTVAARGRDRCGWSWSPPRWSCAAPSSSAPAWELVTLVYLFHEVLLLQEKILTFSMWFNLVAMLCRSGNLHLLKLELWATLGCRTPR